MLRININIAIVDMVAPIRKQSQQLLSANEDVLRNRSLLFEQDNTTNVSWVI